MRSTFTRNDIQWEMTLEEGMPTSWIGQLDEFCVHVDGRVMQNRLTGKRHSAFRILPLGNFGRPDWLADAFLEDKEAKTAEEARERAEEVLLDYVNGHRREQLANQKLVGIMK